MKSAAARSDPVASIRPVPVRGARRGGPAASLDHVEVLGLSEAELTPAVQAALATLMVELQSLRGEAQRLKARLAEAEAAADADPLTSARNRRAFVRELRRAQAYARRHGTQASLIYFDLDGLKNVNDRFGHAAGDAALQATADRLASQVRESDMVGRLGGDEFAVLLVGADLASARAKAEALARRVASAPAGGVAIRLSWGACQVDPGKDPEALIAEADAAMFAMKRARPTAA